MPVCAKFYDLWDLGDALRLLDDLGIHCHFTTNNPLFQMRMGLIEFPGNWPAGFYYNPITQIHN